MMHSDIPKKNHLSDQVALITGGGTGLGLGIARALADTGARVVISGRTKETLENAKTSIGQERCSVVVGDVTVAHDRLNMVSQANAAFGVPVTILINNAGVHLKKAAAQITDDEFHGVLATHVHAAFALARDVYPQMRKAGQGSILFMASMTSFIGMTHVVAYSTAKSAIVGLTRSLAAEWSAQGIRVNAIAPGWIESPMLRQALDGDPAREEKILDRIFTGEFGSSDDIGQAAVFLCSSAAKYITGIVLPVDGGGHIGF